MQILFYLWTGPRLGLDNERCVVQRLHEALVLGHKIFPFSSLCFFFSYVCSHGSQINAVYYIGHVYRVGREREKKEEPV